MLELAAPLAFVAQRVATARGYDRGKPYDAAWEGLDEASSLAASKCCN